MLKNLSSTSTLIGRSYTGAWLKAGPHRMLETLVNPVYFGCFVYAYHGGNVITRLSHSGIVFLLTTH